MNNYPHPVRKEAFDTMTAIRLSEEMDSHNFNIVDQLRSLVAQAVAAVQNPSTSNTDITAIQELEVSSKSRVNQIQINNIVNINAVGILNQMDDLVSKMGPLRTVGDEILEEEVDFHKATRRFQRELVKRVLKMTGYNKEAAYKILGVARSTLYEILDEITNKKTDLIDIPKTCHRET